MNHLKLKAVLAERQLTQWRLATDLKIHPSTFSEYLRGARRPPANLARRIERELKLAPGSINHDA